MPLFDIFPLWRIRSPFVWRFGTQSTDKAPYISDKIARDIGLDATAHAKLRHQWPSQSIPHDQHDHLVRHIKGR